MYKGRDRLFLYVFRGHCPAAIALGLVLAGQPLWHVMIEAAAPAAVATLGYAHFA